MKLFALIVTYNRLKLLKECISALKEQTLSLDKIYILNNCSTDGTDLYLSEFNNDSQIKIIHLQKNIGGAGGYNEGIKQAILDGADWVWCMDDDTIPFPNALEELVKPIQQIDNVGFICSKVLWTNNRIHKMNIPAFENNKKESLIDFSDKADVLKICSCSFVSVMVNSTAVKQVGLPIKEFFIWSDDHEFTLRIRNKSFWGLYAYNSIVYHKTNVNYGPSLYDAPAEMAWKFEYGIRNCIYMQRPKKNRIYFYLSALNTYRRFLRRIRHRNAEDKQIFKKAIKNGVWNGIFFNPKIEYLPKEKTNSHLNE